MNVVERSQRWWVDTDVTAVEIAEEGLDYLRGEGKGESVGGEGQDAVGGEAWAAAIAAPLLAGVGLEEGGEDGTGRAEEELVHKEDLALGLGGGVN